jgi:NAD-dependent deacetylase
MANLVILTGAGVCAESGAATFRDANGLWESDRISRLEDSDMLRLDQAMIVVLGLGSPGARLRG